MTLTVPTPDGRTVRYEPYIENGMAGFRCVRDDGQVRYLYLNPSNNDDASDDPNVFLYEGVTGNPTYDGPIIHVVQEFPEARGRVYSIPIVESDSCPRRLLFEGAEADAEAFYFDHIEREDVDEFYVLLERDSDPE